MKTATKITLSIIGIIAVLAIVFFIVPVDGYKEWKKKVKEINSNMLGAKVNEGYARFCYEYWLDKFASSSVTPSNDLTYDGNVLPEIVVTPQA